MKTKISKKVLSLCLSLLICISALPVTMLSASASSYNINIRNIVCPRPDAVPQGNVTADGDFSYELVGWLWQSYSQVAMGPDEFKTYYSQYLAHYGAYSELKKFNDTETYELMFMFVVKDKIIPGNTGSGAKFYDENGNLIKSGAEYSFVTVEKYKTMIPKDMSLPDSLTDNDTLLICSADNIRCSPADHKHLQGNFTCDENRHWRECSVCGKKMVGTDAKHSGGCYGTESWTKAKVVTSTQDGLYEKLCSYCKTPIDSITVPKTGEQTIVTSYDELRDALAKGGKQWITLDFPSKVCNQEDSESDNTLCVDDPEADITIDLNNCILSRTTAYDKHLFEIKQGSLRLWQESGNGIDSTSTGSFHNNLSFSNESGESVFYVGESGSLRLTNVHAMPLTTDGIYNFKVVESYGNLRIDSGVYKSYVDTPTVKVFSGNVVINGGKFESQGNLGTALSISGKDDSKTTATINYGNFGAYNIAVSTYKNTDVTINGGLFDYEDADKNIRQNTGLYVQEGDLTVNGGYFYSSNYGLDAYNPNSLNISNGYFKTYDKTFSDAIYIIGDCSTNTTISGGTFVGKYGIECSRETDFSKIIPDGCFVTDYETDLVVDHKITAYHLGSMEIDALDPVITTQPSGGHSSTMGDSIVLKIEAENANEYTWHIIDEDGKELTWNYLSNNGYANPQVASGGKMLFLKNVSDWMTGKRVYCVVKGYGGTVMSDIVTLSVDKVIKYCNDLYFDDFDQIWNHKTVADFKNPKNDADAPYTIGNVRWEMFSKILSDDFEFESGDNVAVRIDVIPKEGYTFYSSVYGKLNGIDSYATIKNEDGSRSIVFNMTITTPDEYKTQDIELSVAEPVAGKTPATTAVCTSGYVIPETPAWTPADEIFKTNTEYTVKIPVKAEYAWGDTSTVTAKVNGKDATFIAEYKGGKQYAYYVEYTFDATGSEIAKDYDITVEGGKAYNGSGEEITKCNEGTTVTLKANDPPEGMDFDRWEVVSGDITLADETDPNTTFVMPANEVSVKAIYDLIPHTHIFDSEIIKAEALKTPADCENDAVYYKSCSICEEISDTETFTEKDSALGHSFTNYVSDKNASCIADGTKTAKCDRCDVTDMVIDKGSVLGHSFTNYVSDNNATCTADGTKTAKCDRCDEKDTVTEPAKGHKYSEEWSKDTTNHWHQCSVCGDKKDTEEHIPNIAEPTETQAKVCTVCDYVIADKLPAKNGTVIVDGKTVLYIDGTAVEGTKVVNVEGKTYAVVKGYVVTGKIQTVTISGKTYIVDKNGVVIKSGKNRLVKVNSSKWYVVNKYGIVIKAKSGNTLVKVGSKTYIVNKYGLVQKTTTSKLLNVGKKTYAVVKDSVLTGKTRTITISGKTYIVDKNGAVIKSTANKLVKVSKSNWYVVSKAGTVIKAKKGNILVKVSKKSYIVNKKGLVLKNKKSVKVGKKTYKINKYGIATRKK
ncbi:MAG: hypothetical protein ACI4HZ_08745 [Ruminococcus sp.]